MNWQRLGDGDIILALCITILCAGLVALINRFTDRDGGP
jgi:hypothetical protein